MTIRIHAGHHTSKEAVKSRSYASDRYHPTQTAITRSRVNLSRTLSTILSVNKVRNFYFRFKELTSMINGPYTFPLHLSLFSRSQIFARRALSFCDRRNLNRSSSACSSFCSSAVLPEKPSFPSTGTHFPLICFLDANTIKTMKL